MQILVKTVPTGKSFALDVEPTVCFASVTTYDLQQDTIQAIKQKSQDRGGIPPDQQQFLYGTVLLRDDGTLEEYGITKESWISLVRIRGDEDRPCSTECRVVVHCQGREHHFGTGAHEQCYWFKNQVAKALGFTGTQRENFILMADGQKLDEEHDMSNLRGVPLEAVDAAADHTMTKPAR